MTELESGEKNENFGGIRRVIPLLMMVGAMWVVEIIDRAVPGANLDVHGIHPRQLDGLPGILFAPFLHAGWGHLLGNTAGLLILGSIVLIRGLRTWADLTVAAIIVGGLFTWVFGAPDSNHIGASGIVFAYFGYLMGAAFFERSIQAGALALVAILFYGSIWYGLIPQDGVSWAGHAGGLISGLVVARVNSERRKPELEHAE